METNFAVRSRPIRWLYLATRETSWRVMRVSELEQEHDPHVLRDRPRETRVHAVGRRLHIQLRCMRTGVPGRGDLPGGSLPDKWQPFVEINYAYGKGMDVVNNLTDAYATEHNVQNPPLE